MNPLILPESAQLLGLVGPVALLEGPRGESPGPEGVQLEEEGAGEKIFPAAVAHQQAHREPRVREDGRVGGQVGDGTVVLLPGLGPAPITCIRGMSYRCCGRSSCSWHSACTPSLPTSSCACCSPGYSICCFGMEALYSDYDYIPISNTPDSTSSHPPIPILPHSISYFGRYLKFICSWGWFCSALLIYQFWNQRIKSI